MVKRSAHPDKQLFQYLSGSLDEQAAAKIETHLSACPDCAALASVVRMLKSEAAAAGSPRSEGPFDGLEASMAPAASHPGISELASLFYGGSSRESASATARHVATCESCARELALYAQAERMASGYEPARAVGGEVPQAAREMIRDWEESNYAKPRPEEETLSHEMLTRLVHLLGERRDQLLDMKRHVIESSSSREADVVPVLIIDSSGEFRGVEIFHREEGGAAGILKHSDGSGRFDNKIVHALVGFRDREPVVITEVVRRDAIELKRISRLSSDPDGAEYFIIED
ncbi:MAG TPA: zf-HC2 domain-containing protein [Blastocatellia bacterium]|nr:zf-HC2 domain-containing protein [Blastocatellia bacterium]